jgi:hypothetical protein
LKKGWLKNESWGSCETDAEVADEGLPGTELCEVVRFRDELSGLAVSEIPYGALRLAFSWLWS